MNAVLRHWLTAGSAALGLALVTGSNAIAQSVCANVSNNWSSSSGASATLNQAADGSITGLLAVPPFAQCNQTVSYVIESGSYSNGGFTFTAEVGLGTPVNQNCANSITVSGTITGAGCDRLEFSSKNSLGGVTWGTFIAPAVIPKESSVATNEWIFPDPRLWNCSQPDASPDCTLVNYAQTIGKFEATLSGGPGDYNFGGRTIKETFTTSNDSCHFARSRFPYFIPTASASFVLGDDQDNQYQDQVGTDAAEINWYRFYQQAPCSFTTNQVMTISTSSGPVGYTNNAMAITVGDSVITSSRTPVSADTQSKTWGESQTQYEAQRSQWEIIHMWLFTHGLFLTPPTH